MIDFPKKKPLKSKENLETIRDQPCIACHAIPPSDPAHLKSRKSGGGDELENLIPLCRRCHVEQHYIGIKSFIDKYNLPISKEETGWYRRTDL